jgi:hypothetical protein
MLCGFREEPGKVSVSAIGPREAAFNAQWKHHKSIGCGDGRWLSGIVELHLVWPWNWIVVTQIDILGWWWCSVSNRSAISSHLVGCMPWFLLCCLDWGWLPASAWSVQLQWGTICSPLTWEEAPRKSTWTWRKWVAGGVYPPTGQLCGVRLWSAGRAVKPMLRCWNLSVCLATWNALWPASLLPWCLGAADCSCRGAGMYSWGLPVDMSQ